MTLKFSLKYFLLALVIFIIEIIIGTILKDIYIVRAFLGDVLVVILLYFGVLSFFEVKNRGRLLLGIFGFAVMIETAQYFKIADTLGFQEGSIAHIVVGNYFSWEDILCYAVGCFLMFCIEKARETTKKLSEGKGN